MKTTFCTLLALKTMIVHNSLVGEASIACSELVKDVMLANTPELG